MRAMSRFRIGLATYRCYSTLRLLDRMNRIYKMIQRVNQAFILRFLFILSKR
jgi:hypothetical protein